MSSTAKWVLGIIAGFLALGTIFFFLLFMTFLSDSRYDESASTSGEKVAVIELREPILSSEETVRQFKKYRGNKSVKAIVFRVESPGGGVAASQEIYEEVKKTRDSGKPIVVSMGSVAASGGYYVSCGASKIVANPGTLTGSIGVNSSSFTQRRFSERSVLMPPRIRPDGSKTPARRSENPRMQIRNSSISCLPMCTINLSPW